MANTERLSVQEIPERKRKGVAARRVIDFPKDNLTLITELLEERIVTRITDFLSSQAVVAAEAPPPAPPSGEAAQMMLEMRETLEQIRVESRRSAQSAVAASVNGAAIGVFQAIASLLAVRLILLLTLAGGFTLAVTAIHQGTPVSVAVLVAYALLFIFPVAALEYRGKIRKGD